MSVPFEVMSRVMLGKFNDAEKAVIWRALMFYYRDGYTEKFAINTSELARTSGVSSTKLTLAIRSLTERGVLIEDLGHGWELGSFLLVSPQYDARAGRNVGLSDWGRSTHSYE